MCDYSCFGSLDASKRTIRLSKLLGFQTNRRRSTSRTDLFKHLACFSKNLISTAPRCLVTFHWSTNRLFLQSSFDLELRGRNLSTTSRKPVRKPRFRSRIVAKAPIVYLDRNNSLGISSPSDIFRLMPQRRQWRLQRDVTDEPQVQARPVNLR